MNAARLSNPIKQHAINGQTYNIGKLTIGAAVEIETYLATLKTPLEKIQESKILEQVDKDVANGIIDTALQELAFFPPDAITALCDRKYLGRAEFGRVFLRAIFREYNRHLSPEEIDRVAMSATVEDIFVIQAVALGADADPKGGSVADAQTTTSQPNA